jgi:hypothetical protein
MDAQAVTIRAAAASRQALKNKVRNGEIMF